jgi:hypothetical protein
LCLHLVPCNLSAEPCSVYRPPSAGFPFTIHLSLLPFHFLTMSSMHRFPALICLVKSDERQCPGDVAEKFQTFAQHWWMFKLKNSIMFTSYNI